MQPWWVQETSFKNIKTSCSPQTFVVQYNVNYVCLFLRRVILEVLYEVYVKISIWSLFKLIAVLEKQLRC